MRRSKKIISLLISVIMLLGMAAVHVSAEESAIQYRNEIDVVTALGIMINQGENGNDSNADLTRAEFAQALYVLMKFDTSENSKAYYRQYMTNADNDNTVLHPETEVEVKSRFADVSPDYWAKETIEAIVSCGYMAGTTETTFEPDEFVTVNQVAKTFVKILGYEPIAQKSGGYPIGYNHTAGDIKLLKGVAGFGEDSVTHGELAKIICNMFDINLMETTPVGTNGELKLEITSKTFINDIMNIDVIKGVVTDNGVTTLFGKSEIASDKVKIGSNSYQILNGKGYVRNLIGRKVEAYVSNDSNNSVENLIYARIIDDSSDIVMDVDDFVSVNSGNVKYFEGDVSRIVNIAELPYIIFNGKAVKFISTEAIKKYLYGTVTLTSSYSKDDYVTIVLDLYESWLVDSIDKENMKIINGVEGISDSQNSSVDLSSDDVKNFVVVYENGAEVDFSDVTVGSILDISRNGNDEDGYFTKLIITKKTVENATVLESENYVGIRQESYNIVTSMGTYTVSNDFLNGSNGFEPELGKTYTLYLNSFGKVAYMKVVAGSVDNIMLLAYIDNKNKKLSEKNRLKLFNSKGQYSYFDLDEKVRVTFEDNTEKNVKSSELDTEIGDRLGKLITYELSPDGVIKRIILPSNINDRYERKQGVLGAVGKIQTDGSTGSYVSNNKNFGGLFIATVSTVLFNIDTTKNATDDDRYSIYKFEYLKDLTKYNAVGYNTVVGSPTATYVVFEDLVATKSIDYVSDIFRNFVVVTKVSNTLDAEGSNAVKVYGYKINTDNTAAPVAVSLLSNNGAFDNMKAAFNGTTTPVSSVRVGDIIVCREVDGNVEEAALVYGSQISYPDGSRSGTGAIAGATSSLYIGPNNGLGTNPIGIYNNVIATSNKISDPTDFRLFDGFVYDYIDGALIYTNQDLAEEYYSVNNTTYIEESIPMPSRSITITYGENNVTVKDGSRLDIKTYKKYGNDCSRVLVNSKSGRINKVIIIN